MSVRGDLIVECDTPTCHAEQAFTVLALWRHSIRTALQREGWLTTHDGKDICPQCVEARGE